MKTIMSGNFVKEKIERAGFPLAEVARNMNITPQTLNERLNVNDIKVGVLQEIARGMGKSIYFFFEETPVDIKGNLTREPKTRYSANRGTKPAEPVENDENMKLLLQAKDDIISAQQKTIHAYELLFTRNMKD